jgi:peptidoglycan/xylan/chitin deacetylase (PgdA/CDA1 family)
VGDAVKKSRLGQRVSFLVLPLLAIVYVLGPFGLSVKQAQSLLPPGQELTIAVPLTATELQLAAELHEYWDALPNVPLVITYHDVHKDPQSKYTVTPPNFAAHMAMLKAAGANVIDGATFASYQKGGSLPPRSIMITFDDSTRGVWRFAEPVMREIGFPAVVFAITGYVGTHHPYYMTWKELADLSATGRWDIEAHSHLGHRSIPTDAEGGDGSFLGSFAWLPAENRLETATEYQARVTTDLDTSIAELRSRGYGKQRFMAYPFSDYGQRGQSNEKALLDDVVRPRFAASFNDDLRTLPLHGPRQFNRVTITQDVTPAVLTARLHDLVTANLKLLAGEVTDSPAASVGGG